MRLVQSGPNQQTLIDEGIVLGQITRFGRTWHVTNIQRGATKPMGEWDDPETAAAAIGQAVTIHDYRSAVGDDGLSGLQRDVLAFEGVWWGVDDRTRAEAFRREFPTVGDVTYRQQILALVDSGPAALRAPAVVAMLKRRLDRARRVHRTPRSENPAMAGAR